MSENVFAKNFEILCNLTGQIVDWIKANSSEQIELSSGEITMGKAFVMLQDNGSLAKGFIKRSFNYWDSIKARDEEFLINNAGVLFNELDEKYIKEFNKIFSLKKEDGSPLLEQATKDSLWNIPEAMVKNCIKYIHEQREMKEVKNPETGVVTKQYTKEFFPDIRVSVQVKKFNVK